MRNEAIYHIYQSEKNKKLIDFQICGITYPDKNYVIERTNSSIACIEFVERGEGVVWCDNIKYNVSGGDSYFLQSGNDQYYFADGTNPWKKYFVNCRGVLLDKLTEGYNLKNEVFYPGLDIKKELVKIIDLTKNQKGDNTVEMVGILASVFDKMYHQKDESNAGDKLPYKMKKFLDLKATERFSIGDLAAYISHSESQTIRIFKNAFGITPYAYFINKKIQMAKTMLLNTNLSVKQIAYELNFADEYYFSNIFKAKTGFSPKVYKSNASTL